MVASDKNNAMELEAALEKAVKFHGHLGPFLTLGVRMGLVGIRELGVHGKEKELRVTAILKYSVPFSCVLDGIQVATKCTVGNKKLCLRNKAKQIAAIFELRNGEEVKVLVNPSVLEKLKTDLQARDALQADIRKLAQVVASMPEEELFIINR